MKKTIGIIAALALFPAPALANNSADPQRLRADVERLVSFGTRHTLSSADHPTRGIGAARRWAAAEFARIGKQCGGCITVEQIDRRFTGPRAPEGVNVVNVLGVQKGSGNPDDIIILSAHIDSRVSDIADFTSDAPGANDDGSGSALVLEAARILSKQRFGPTIIYALLSGEEQGLWGGRLIAETARARGWQVRALLNNDIVGNTMGQDGRTVADRVRVFSEGIRASESLAEA
ncbi:M28 family peptidase, partial [Blastomonas sp.]|uniref:M28 family peptidase n=1 Tax=Blastomonas sp. TaxID=1909299 RepID=UPI0035943A0F